MTTPSGPGGENVPADPWAQRPEGPMDAPDAQDRTIPASDVTAGAQPTEVIGQQWNQGENWNAGQQWNGGQQWSAEPQPEAQWAQPEGQWSQPEAQWSQTPEGYEPTTQYPAPGYPGGDTARYAAGYPAAQGYSPAEGYPATEQGYPGGPGYPPGQGYPPGPGYPPAGPGGPGMPGVGGPQPPKRRTGFWVGIAAAVALLVVGGGILVGVVLGNQSSVSSQSSAPGTTNLFPPTQTPMFTVPSTGPNAPSTGVPGLGNPDGGGAMGTVQSNDGGTLIVQELGGDSVTVHTDSSTQILALGANTVADLRTGDLIVVQGDKAPDGSIQAKIIFSTTMPTH